MTCIWQNIYFLIFGILYIHTFADLDKDGYCRLENVTFKTSNGTDTSQKKYCCTHYEEKNNTCKACKVGYTSSRGKQCHQCEAGMYGNRCAYTCNCEVSQRCHHVRGCISPVGVTRIPSSVYTITEENTLNRNKVITKQQLLLYIVSTACFVLLIGIVCLGWKYKKKSQSRRVLLSTIDHNTNDNKNIDLNLVNHNTVESAYDEIDESCIVNSLTTVQISKPSIYTYTLDESALLTQRNNIHVEQNLVSSEYLTPISGSDIIDDKSDIQDTSIIIAVETPECFGRLHSAVSDYLIPVNTYQDNYMNDSNSACDDYLHPYTSVVSSLQKNTITADIHTVNQSSSESDEEANGHNYSHLYEQLSHDWKDNCPTYTHPLPPKRSLTQNVRKQNTKESNTFQKDDPKDNGASGFCEMKTSIQSSPNCP